MANTSDVNYPLIERIRKLMPVTEYRRMEDPEDREAMFHLRYESYHNESNLPYNEEKRFTDDIDELPNTQNFGVYISGILASCLRLSVLSVESKRSMCSDCFPEVLMPRINSGKRILDPTRLVINSKIVGQFPELPYITMKLPVMACLHFGIDECIQSVRPEHKSFYRRVFHAEALCEPRYQETLVRPLMLMKSEVSSLYDELDHRFPFWRSNYLERRQIFGPAENMPGVSAKDCDRAA